MRGYTIWIGEGNHQSAGVRALHVLRDELVRRGLHASMAYESHTVGNIVVYPEIVTGNPLGESRIVRWKLNRAALPDDGMTVVWVPGMESVHGVPILTVDVIERDLWVPYHGPREGVAYWVGKGRLAGSKVPDGAVEITRKSHPDRVGLASFVRRLDYLISFDPFTMLTTEAIVSGTPVLIHAGDNQWQRDDIERAAWTTAGVAWSEDELEFARSDVWKAWTEYEFLRSVFQGRIDRFVKESQRRFA